MRPGIPVEVLKARLEKLRRRMEERGLDTVMIRTLSSFRYFTGVKWLRPALLIPLDGEPIAFVARGEEEGFKRMTWIRDVRTFVEGGELMSKVSSTVRSELKARRVRLDYSVERDSYSLFYEMFKRLNPGVEVVDVHEDLAELRMIKDEWERELIRRAGELARKALERALSTVEPGVAETEVAAEAYYSLYKSGCEDPLVYVNAGPGPRVHAELLSSVRVRTGTTVTIVVGADYGGYYANAARTVVVGDCEKGSEALRAMERVYELAVELTRPGARFIDVIRALDRIYEEEGLLSHRLLGYAHGVGLQVEEEPITTIIPRHRFIRVRRGMTLAMVHAPLLIHGVGQVKLEDTFLVGDELEKLT